jgi:hypothetical protein
MDALQFFDMLADFEIEQTASKSMEYPEVAEEITFLNRAQMYDGKRNDGRDIFPTYYDDPYFKTRQDAIRYSDWKDKITPNSKRTQGVPNLVINGYFYNSIDVKVEGNDITYHTNADFSPDIISKFSEDIFGLDDDYRERLINIMLEEKWETEVTVLTGLNFTK